MRTKVKKIMVLLLAVMVIVVAGCSNMLSSKTDAEKKEQVQRKKGRSQKCVKFCCGARAKTIK